MTMKLLEPFRQTFFDFFKRNDFSCDDFRFRFVNHLFEIKAVLNFIPGHVIWQIGNDSVGRTLFL